MVLSIVESSEITEWLQTVDVLDGHVARLFPVPFPAITRLAHDDHEGTPPLALAQVLGEVLGRLTDSSADVYYCVWEGWGGLLYRPAGDDFAVLTSRKRPTCLFRRLRRRLRGAPPVERGPVQIPNRGYFLLKGSMADVETSHTRGGYQGASMWWPEDQRWFVATEVDATATYVGSSAECASNLRKLDGATAADPTEYWV